MKLFKQYTSPVFLLVLVFSVFTVACSDSDTDTIPSITATADDGSTTVVDTVLDDVLTTLPLEDLSQAEVDGLLFMREEEKLARDVYIYLYNQWSSEQGSGVFDGISSAEQTHTDAILTLLNRYGIADPVGDNAEGVFEDPALQTLYNDLITIGSSSLESALYVGAEIEEIDILDIQKYVDEVEGNEDIILVYENLMKGSRNHLRSFVKTIDNLGFQYEPSHLTPEEYYAIINSAMETNK